MVRVGVKAWSIAKRQGGLGRMTAGLALLLWFVTQALAASPGLHRLLHGDFQGINHQCLVTQVQQHLLLGGGQAVLAPVAPPPVPGPRIVAEPSFCATRDYRVSPSRAPPSVFSSTPVVG